MPSCKTEKDYLLTIKTPCGEMKVILYEETPKHKENFIKLAKEDFCDNILFHRVIKDFLTQEGDPNSKGTIQEVPLGSGGLGYQISAEFVKSLFHEKEVLSAARTNNPEKESSGSQLYYSTRKSLRGSRTHSRYEFWESFPTNDRALHLKDKYTVFGKVASGLEVIGKIAERPLDRRDRPLTNISMVVELEGLPKKKIAKEYGYIYPEE